VAELAISLAVTAAVTGLQYAFASSDLNGYANILTEYCSTSEFSDEIWAQDFGCGAKSTPSIQPTTKSSTSQTSKSCDLSYPDFCIPSSPPDLDCNDISQKKFTVLQPDPHRFDGDKDGIGCES
jgi:micrococcal nuclease